MPTTLKLNDTLKTRNSNEPPSLDRSKENCVTQLKSIFKINKLTS